MKLWDEKGRIFGKISVVDLAIIFLFVLALGWFLYSRFGVNLRRQIEERTVPCEITLLVPAVRRPTVEAIRKSQAMFEFKTNAYVGTVSSVREEPANVWFLNNDGRWVMTPASDRSDVYVTLKAEARVGENVITVNGVEVRVGQSVNLKSKWVAVSGFIYAVEFPEGGAQ
ncbi:MAG TPA: DUF4330 domain-containing protein [Firmicutes bacterium]|nr:DUF4330 domain-containing protein [Candidatus Fermentithermobacillaceae bacterium]